MFTYFLALPFTLNYSVTVVTPLPPLAAPPAGKIEAQKDRTSPLHPRTSRDVMAAICCCL